MPAGVEYSPLRPDWELFECEGDSGQAEWCEGASKSWSWEAERHQIGPAPIGLGGRREWD